MYTYNDILFSVLHSCKDGLSASRLTYYVYMYQLCGLNYNFKYKLRASGVESRAIDSYLNSLIAEGKVDVKNGTVTLTKLGDIYYNEIALSFEEWEHLDRIKEFLDNLSDSELYFITIIDIIVTSESKLGGTSGLIAEKDRIKQSIANLSTEYSDENFDNALKAIRFIKEGFDNE